jgi:hypothetical protein
VQDHTIFSYDDVFFLPPGAPGGHIRAIRRRAMCSASNRHA